MKKAGIILLTLLFLNLVSANSFINIYVTENGESIFYGETFENNLSLPAGITISKGMIIGKTQDLTSKNGNIWSFSYNLPDSELRVSLPEGSRILNQSSSDIYLEGNSLSIYSLDSLDFSYIIEPKNDYSWIYLIILIIAALSIFYLIKLKKSRHNLNLVEKLLNEREKIILDNLKKFGKLKSSILRKECDIPKASFSRHLHELRKKGMIRISGEGKNKFIELMSYLTH